jgi:hypothetical protein
MRKVFNYVYFSRKYMQPFLSTQVIYVCIRKKPLLFSLLASFVYSFVLVCLRMALVGADTCSKLTINVIDFILCVSHIICTHMCDDIGHCLYIAYIVYNFLILAHIHLNNKTTGNVCFVWLGSIHVSRQESLIFCPECRQHITNHGSRYTPLR